MSFAERMIVRAMDLATNDVESLLFHSVVVHVVIRKVVGDIVLLVERLARGVKPRNLQVKAPTTKVHKSVARRRSIINSSTMFSSEVTGSRKGVGCTNEDSVNICATAVAVKSRNLQVNKHGRLFYNGIYITRLHVTSMCKACDGYNSIVILMICLIR